MIADIAEEYNLWIIADEVYREFVYEGEYVSIGTIEKVKDRVIIVDSVSKRYSACGARIGSLASKNKSFMEGILKLCQARLSVPTLEQVGAIELYKTDNSYLKEVNEEYRYSTRYSPKEDVIKEVIYLYNFFSFLHPLFKQKILLLE